MLVASAASSQAADGRDYISIVGSSTVYPFTTTVAEQFGKSTKFKTPKIESTGTGGGFKLFCAGVGVAHPDITNASRRMKKSEMETCQKNGVTEVVEVKVGYDGIVVANSKNAELFKLTRKELFMALAKQVPSPEGGDTLVPIPTRPGRRSTAPCRPIRLKFLARRPPRAPATPLLNW
jgi:phosphate transport system substrate-binding protein